MSRVITIRFEIPDGVTVRIDGAPPEDVEDEPLPPPGWGQAVPGTSPMPSLVRSSSFELCPVHRAPWRVVAAGVSKSGKSYGAFRVCSADRICPERPRAANAYGEAT